MPSLARLWCRVRGHHTFMIHRTDWYVCTMCGRTIERRQEPQHWLSRVFGSR